MKPNEINAEIEAKFKKSREAVSNVIDLHALLAILTQLVIMILVSFIAFQFIFTTAIAAGTISLFLGKMFSLIIGYFVTIALFFNKTWRTWWTVYVPKNRAYVLISQGPKITTEGARLSAPARMREIHSGLNFKLPTEKAAWNIDMQADMQIGTKLEVKTLDNQLATVEWQIKLTPLEGYLVNLVSKGPEQGIAFFTGDATAFINRWFWNHNLEDYFKKKPNYDELNEEEKKKAKENDIDEQFKDFYNGEGIHDKERSAGLFTGIPQIVRVTLSTEMAKAKQATKITHEISSQLTELKRNFPGIDINTAFLRIAEIAGTQTNTINIVSTGDESGKDAKTLAMVEGQKQSGKKKGKK